MRPATDQLRQAIFNSLADRVAGARFLDLFAGSGSYGLEAMSRGAAGGVFVERHRASVGVLRSNLVAVCRSAGCEPERCTITAADVFRWTPGAAAVFDLVFCDPPYAILPDQGEALLARITPWLAPGGLLALELPGDLPPPSPPLLTFRKRLGSTAKGSPSVALFDAP